MIKGVSSGMFVVFLWTLIACSHDVGVTVIELSMQNNTQQTLNLILSKYSDSTTYTIPKFSLQKIAHGTEQEYVDSNTGYVTELKILITNDNKEVKAYFYFSEENARPKTFANGSKSIQNAEIICNIEECTINGTKMEKNAP